MQTSNSITSVHILVLLISISCFSCLKEEQPIDNSKTFNIHFYDSISNMPIAGMKLNLIGRICHDKWWTICDYYYLDTFETDANGVINFKIDKKTLDAMWSIELFVIETPRPYIENISIPLSEFDLYKNGRTFKLNPATILKVKCSDIYPGNGKACDYYSIRQTRDPRDFDQFYLIDWKSGDSISNYAKFYKWDPREICSFISKSICKNNSYSDTMIMPCTNFDTVTVSDYFHP